MFTLYGSFLYCISLVLVHMGVFVCAQIEHEIQTKQEMAHKCIPP